MFLEGFIFIGAVILLVYISLYIANNLKKNHQGASAVYDLSVPNQLVLPTSDFKWSSSACTLRFAIFVNTSPKTIAKVDCIADSTSNPPIDAQSFAPSCSDYSFKACKCLGTDCGRCVLDDTNSGYMSKLVSVGDYMALWASGYTNQNDKAYVPALLKIRTGQDSSQHYMESVPLPAIPLQKWTIITIVKEGRRFDVYYGAVLKTSTLTTYVPVTPDASQQIFAGNARWSGTIGMFNGFTKPFYAPDVLKDVEGIADTRGIPAYEENLPMFALPSCLFGFCGALPDVKPPNQFMVYDTKFA